MARNMDKWLGDGGMPIISALGASFDAYGSDLGAGWVSAMWTPTELACNPAKIVHAGTHAVMLDAAMNFSVNASLESPDRAKATLMMNTEYVRAAVLGEELRVRGSVTRATRQVAFAAASITNAKDELVSRCTATFALHRGG